MGAASRVASLRYCRECIKVPVTSQAAISVDKNMSQFPRVTGLWKLEEEETTQPHRHTDRKREWGGGQETRNSERILYLPPVPEGPLGSRAPTGGVKGFLSAPRGLRGQEASFHCQAGA